LNRRQAKNGIQFFNAQPHPSAGKQLGVYKDLIDGNAETQRGNRQIRSLETQGGESDQNAEQPCRQTGNQNRQRPGYPEATQVSESECADREKSRLPERDLPRVADEQILPLNPDGIMENECCRVNNLFPGNPGQNLLKDNLGTDPHPRPGLPDELQFLPVAFNEIHSDYLPYMLSMTSA
jgi:hypothetical protein